MKIIVSNKKSIDLIDKYQMSKIMLKIFTKLEFIKWKHNIKHILPILLIKVTNNQMQKLIIYLMNLIDLVIFLINSKKKIVNLPLKMLKLQNFMISNKDKLFKLSIYLITIFKIFSIIINSSKDNYLILERETSSIKKLHNNIILLKEIMKNYILIIEIKMM
jgi:hypothetical protein